MFRNNGLTWKVAFWALFFFPLMAGGVQAEPIKLIMTHEIALSHWKHPFMEKYGKMVEERSKGTIKAELYPSGQLYSDRNAVAALGTGGVHMVWPVTQNVETIAPAFAINSFPMFLEDQIMLKGPQFKRDLREMLSKHLAHKKIRLMGMVRSGEALPIFRKGLTPKRLLDMKGLKIRVIGGLLWLDVFKSWGATAVGMPASEMAAALAQGVIDGIQTGSAGWLQMVGMTAPYGLRMSGIYIGTYQVLVDDRWFSQLPQEIRKVMQGTLDELLTAQWKEGIDLEAQEFKAMEKQGARIHVLTKEELKKDWLPLCKPAVENFAKRFPEAYKEALAIKAKYD